MEICFEANIEELNLILMKMVRGEVSIYGI